MPDIALLVLITMEKKKIFMDWLDLLNGTVEPGNIIELPVLSDSMKPMLLRGKNVKIKASSCRDVRIGDIIVFRVNNSLITHRLLLRFSISEKIFLYQKGDAGGPGSWINQDQVVGLVCSIQNGNNEYHNLTGSIEKWRAKKLALIGILKTIWNILLIFPRGIKRWLIKI